MTYVENMMRNSRNEFTILTYPQVPDIPVLRALLFVLWGFLRGLRLRYDIIHAHYAMPQGFLGVLLKIARRKPLVLTVHGSDAALGRGSLAPILRWVLRRSDRITTVSRFLQREVIALGAREGAVRVVYGGVTPKAPPGEGSSGGARIVFVGSLVRQKGVDILLEAFQEVKGAEKGAELWIVGDGRERPRLEALARGLEGVRFLGRRDDLTAVFDGASVLVLPSRAEGFGLVLLEAMASGVPVVASRVGGIEEVVEDGVNGLLVEKENPKALAQGILRLLEDGGLRERLVRNGLATARGFPWERTAREVDEVYAELVG